MYEQEILDVIESDPGLTTEKIIDRVLAGQPRSRSKVRNCMHWLADEGWLTRKKAFKAVHWYKATGGRP